MVHMIFPAESGKSLPTSDVYEKSGPCSWGAATTDIDEERTRVRSPTRKSKSVSRAGRWPSVAGPDRIGGATRSCATASFAPACSGFEGEVPADARACRMLGGSDVPGRPQEFMEAWGTFLVE